jgi:hypothetical protein
MGLVEGKDMVRWRWVREWDASAEAEGRVATAMAEGSEVVVCEGEWRRRGEDVD